VCTGAAEAGTYPYTVRTVGLGTKLSVMDLFVSLLPTIGIIALIAVLVLLANRSLTRQRNSKLKRGHEESKAASRIQEKHLL
jgi:hypothetical protein